MHFKNEKSFDWLLSQNITEIKEVSRVLLACQLWNIETDLAKKLIKEKEDGHWNNSLRDTSRSVSALAKMGIAYPDIENWILEGVAQGAAEPEAIASLEGEDGSGKGADAGDGKGDGVGADQAEGLLVHAGQPEHDELSRFCLRDLGVQHKGADGAGLISNLTNVDGLWQGQSFVLLAS